MTVRGTQTQLAPLLRQQRMQQCKGSLCVRRNGHTPKPRQFTVLAGFGPDHNLGVYNNSVDTIERAFTERYFLCKDGEGFRPAFEVGPSAYKTPEFSEFRAKVLMSMPKLPVLTSQQVVDSYRGSKKRVYQEALFSLEKDELCAKDGEVSAFIKFEKQDVSKAPRPILPKKPRYNLRLAKYLKHAEKRYFRGINVAYGKRTRATVIKGMNADESAQILRDKWDLFKDPVAVGLDATKFDMHVSVSALKYEHSFYLSLFPGSKELRLLLKWQLRTKGFANAIDGVVKLLMEGGRCSGDINTSLGNCIIMCALIWVYAKQLGIDVELANNGDDCVVIMERADVERFRAGVPEFFRSKGFAMTVEDTVDEFERIEFCQTRPVQLSTGWRMVRNLKACLIKDPMCLISIPNEKVYRKWLHAVGTCGQNLTTGVPVHHDFYSFFHREGVECSQGMVEEVFKNRSQLVLAQGLAVASVDARARVSYYYAFNVLPDEQVQMEHLFRTMELGSFVPASIDRDAWLRDPGFNIVTESN